MESRRTAALSVTVLLIGFTLLACAESGSSARRAYDAHSAVVSRTASPAPDAEMDLYRTQAAANMDADYAEQTAVAAKQTAIAIDAEVTMQAIRTQEAREQWAFESTQTAVASSAIAAQAHR